ncbi:GPI ethanolamine phosphate transferase 1 [Halyomorpha halys]|uniref:GPI ethanolamine phosphate transferase 1 n=1 Tax=Halyomorpha halys TaxID=286706 RepID=UPI0034D18140
MVNKIILYGLGSQLIVLSFRQKWVLSLALFGFGFWPGLGISPVIDSKRAVAPRRYQLFWFFSCIGLSIFPLLHILGGKEELFLKIFTGFAWIIIEFVTFKYLGLRFYLVSAIQLFLTPLLLSNIYSTSNSIRIGEGLPLGNQCTSCWLLVLFLGLIYYGPKSVISQFITSSYSVGLTFLIFSSSYEAIFPLLLAVNLLCWIFFERMIDIRYSTWPVSILVCDEIGLHSHDFRRSFFFVFYIMLSFFGIGNLASLNSFDMSWVHSFTRSFSPLIIMSLMVLKILLPLFLVTSAFRSVCYITKAHSKMLFMIALLICDSIAVQFLLSVNNKGSSLEIGISISHFLIMQSIALFLFILYRCTKYTTALRITSSLDCDNVLRKWHDT